MLLILAGRGAQFILMLLITRVATTLMLPSEMGRLSLIVSMTALFALLFVNPVGMFINRRLHAWAESGRTLWYLRYFWGYLAGVAVLAAICLAGLSWAGLAQLHVTLPWLLALVCASLLFNTANQTLLPSLNMLNYRGWFMSLTLLTYLVGFAVAVLLARGITPTAEYWQLGLLTGQAALAIIGYFMFRRLVEGHLPARRALPRVTVQQCRPLFAFAWPVALSVGLNWLQTQGYRFVVERHLGLDTLGLFVSGYGISASLLAAIELVLTTYFQPGYYQQLHAGGAGNVQRAWAVYARCVLPVALLSACFIAIMGSEMTRLFLGPKFHDAAPFVAWGAAAEGLRIAAGVYGLVAHGHMRTHRLLLPSLLGAVTCVAALYALVPLYGATGAGAALVLGATVQVLSLHIAMRREQVLEMPWPQLLQAGGMSLVLLAAVHLCHSYVPASLAMSLVFAATGGLLFMLMQGVLLREYLFLRRK